MQIEINFQFSYPDFHRIENDVLYQLRREVALTFENAEFGRVLEADNDRFTNVFIVPVGDNYFEPDNDLFITYTLQTPLNNGNLGALLLQSIPELMLRIRAQHNIDTRIRIVYTN